MEPELVHKLRSRAEEREKRLIEAEAPWSCGDIPPDEFYEGLEQFNRGEYFEQHETLELLWRADPRLIRRLYQGILKIGVGFYKLRLGNYRGTVNHINGGIAYLRLFEDGCLGVEIGRLIREADDLRNAVVELGPERLSEFDLAKLPKVHYTRRAR